MHNMPEDIRLYDLDPRSPFYEEPICNYCKEPLKYNSDKEILECVNEDCEEGQ